MKDLAALCSSCLPLMDQVGEFIRKEIGQVNSDQIETKALNSLVSYVDKTAEKMLVDGLIQLIPESVFLTEEETVDSQEGEWRWIIDPLDGTTNFLHGIPVFAISVALEHNGELVMGLIQEVNRHENFYAWKGGGAYLNGQAISVSTQPELEGSLLATGFPYYDFARTSDYLEVLHHFMKNSQGIRRLGAAAIDLAFVACGRFEAFFEYGLNPWDVAAGIVLVQEAGGKVCDFKGGNNVLMGRELLATNDHVEEAMLKVVGRLGR